MIADITIVEVELSVSRERIKPFLLKLTSGLFMYVYWFYII